MKFKIVCTNFFKTLSHLQGIVDKKNSLPILSNILIEAKDNDFRKKISDKFQETRNERIKLLVDNHAKEIEKRIFLQSIDLNWKSHIQYLEQLRQVIGLRSYGLRDPLIEYKKEAFSLFENLLSKLKLDFISILLNLKVV